MEEVEEMVEINVTTVHEKKKKDTIKTSQNTMHQIRIPSGQCIYLL